MSALPVFLRRSAWLKWGVALALLATAWTVGLGHWLPHWLRPRIEAAASEALGAPVRLGTLAISPWTLTVQVGALAVGPVASPWLRLREAEARLSPESIWRLAPVLQRLTLVQPELHLQRLAPDRFNVSGVLEHLRRQPAEAANDAGPARFAVFNIALRDGVITLDDRVLDTRHRIDQLRLQLPFISSLPSHVDVTVQPMLETRIDGSPLRLQGRSLPFSQGGRSELDLTWREVDLAHWVTAARGLLPPELRPEVRAGRLDTDLQLVFEQRPAPASPSVAVRGSARLSGLDASMPVPGAGPATLQVGFDALKLQGLETLPLQRQARLGSLGLEGLKLQLRPQAGAPQQRLSVSPDQGPAAAASAKAHQAAAAPWQWALQRLRVQASRIDLQTEERTPWPALQDLLLQVDGLDSRAEAAPATWRLALAAATGGRLQAEGQWQAQGQQGTVRAQLQDWGLPPWLQPVPGSGDWPLALQQATLQADLSAELRLSATAKAPAGLRLQPSRLAVQGLKAAAPRRPDRLAWRELALEGMEAELALGERTGLQRLQLARVLMDGLEAQLLRDASGLFLGQGVAPGRDAAHTEPRAQVGAGARSSAAPGGVAAMPDWRVGELRCQACALSLRDDTVRPAASFQLKQAELVLTGMSQRLDQALGLHFKAQAQGAGRLAFQGEVRPQPMALKGRLGIHALDLRALQPYLNPHLNVVLAGASARADGRLQLREGAAGIEARYQGGLALSDVRVRDRVNDALFLRWSRFSLDNADLGWRAGTLDADLGFMALKDFYGRIIVNPDGRLNLASVVRGQGQVDDTSITTPAARSATPSATPSATTVAAAVPASAAIEPQVRWQGIHLEGGEVDFTDTFIQPNYSARLTRIAGDISAVSSRAPEPAQIEVSGAVDDGAPLRISGSLHPLGAQLHTDIRGTAKGIELTRMTPYAARYAGYAIDKGTLSVSVHYKVQGGRLEADNQVFLDQLTFGDRVESPDATRLPVLLAVSLLKNARGEIDVNLPISGSIDDPQFSVGGIVWKVIVNLLSKAITAPFSLLGGGGSEELGQVAFDPGAATLTAAARERLDALAAKLNDRPQLKLEATGWADPDIDTEGLRQAHVEALMRRAKARAMGLDPQEVTVGLAERSQWLKAAYQGADIAKPRNLVGLAKSLPDEQMAGLLKASARADEAALQELANDRADAVKAHLAERMGADRVRLTASRVAREGQASEKSGGASVQFSLQ